jgi:hypothetical protein
MLLLFLLLMPPLLVVDPAGLVVVPLTSPD